MLSRILLCRFATDVYLDILFFPIVNSGAKRADTETNSFGIQKQFSSGMAAATRWGIISAGLISSDFVQALQGLPQEEHQVLKFNKEKITEQIPGISKIFQRVGCKEGGGVVRQLPKSVC